MLRNMVPRMTLDVSLLSECRHAAICKGSHMASRSFPAAVRR